MNIPLTKPAIGPQDICAMEEAVHSCAITQGDTASSFASVFAGYLGAAGGVPTSSGTSALVLALRTLQVGAGDEVILPTYTCLAVINAVIMAGAKPVLADVCCEPERMDFNLSPETARRVMTSSTKAIIIPHMFGVPGDIRGLMELGVPVIEDITLSLGAVCDAKPVGAWGPISVCSFHASKMIACGEGGMLTAQTPELYERARMLNGWEAEQVGLRFKEQQPEPYQLRYNYHLSDIAAALGISQFSRLGEFTSRRRSLAKRYTERLKGIDGIITPNPDDPSNVFFRYIVFLKDCGVIDALKAYADSGIEAGRGVCPALHYHWDARPEDFPNAERALGSVVSIPLYPALTDEEVDYILDRSVEILSKGNIG